MHERVALILFPLVGRYVASYGAVVLLDTRANYAAMKDHARIAKSLHQFRVAVGLLKAFCPVLCYPNWPEKQSWLRCRTTAKNIATLLFASKSVRHRRTVAATSVLKHVALYAAKVRTTQPAFICAPCAAAKIYRAASTFARNAAIVGRVPHVCTLSLKSCTVLVG